MCLKPSSRMSFSSSCISGNQCRLNYDCTITRTYCIILCCTFFFFSLFTFLSPPSPISQIKICKVFAIQHQAMTATLELPFTCMCTLPSIHWGSKYSPDPSPSFNNPLMFGELTRTWKLHVPSRTFFSSSCHWCGFEHSGTWSFFFRKLSLFFNLSILYNLKTILKQHE